MSSEWENVEPEFPVLRQSDSANVEQVSEAISIKISSPDEIFAAYQGEEKKQRSTLTLESIERQMLPFKGTGFYTVLHEQLQQASEQNQGNLSGELIEHILLKSLNDETYGPTDGPTYAHANNDERVAAAAEAFGAFTKGLYKADEKKPISFLRYLKDDEMLVSIGRVDGLYGNIKDATPDLEMDHTQILLIKQGRLLGILPITDLTRSRENPLPTHDNPYRKTSHCHVLGAGGLPISHFFMDKTLIPHADPQKIKHGGPSVTIKVSPEFNSSKAFPGII